MINVLFLIFAPFVAALLTLVLPKKARDIFVTLFLLTLAYFALSNTFIATTIKIELPHFTHALFILFDVVLLLYFTYEGFKNRMQKVYLLAIIQLLLYVGINFLGSDASSYEIISDDLSAFMYLIINLVGGAIIFYALGYIESEPFSSFKKNSFIALLLFFLGVMNFIVSTNNIETFFLLFELTTLCSFLLIRFRQDEIAVANALRALWMNQIGGVAILIALVFALTSYETIYFDTLLEQENAVFLVPIAFLIVAAYVKSATFPFQDWLLGAMVAPTPVSAILHSATMVKIAPFLILKLSASFTPFISTTLALFGSFVFMGASMMALNKNFFKEILGLSTIALLSLMMALAAIGTKEAMSAAMLLMLFHAISKALLFLQAGVLEKEFHLKYVDDIFDLLSKSRSTSFLILIGFASLTLPPFGAFVAKFLAIEAIISHINSNPLFIIVLLFVSVGSVILTLLYFKVATKLFSDNVEQHSSQTISPYYKISSYTLVVFLGCGIFGMYAFGYLSLVEMLLPTLLIIALALFLSYYKMPQAVRVKEYNCGEKDEFEVAVYNFVLPTSVIKQMMILSIVFIAFTLLGGLL